MRLIQMEEEMLLPLRLTFISSAQVHQLATTVHAYDFHKWQRKLVGFNSSVGVKSAGAAGWCGAIFAICSLGDKYTNQQLQFDIDEID